MAMDTNNRGKDTPDAAAAVVGAAAALSAAVTAAAAAAGLVFFWRRRKTAPAQPPRQILVRRGPEGWKAAEPEGLSEEDKSAGKMRIKKLLTEPTGSGRFAVKLIIEPNARWPDHWHGSAEWCFVAKGTISDHYGEKMAGDFFYNEKGSSHKNM